MRNPALSIGLVLFTSLQFYLIEAQPYIGQITRFAGNFAPNGWEFCDGRLLAISEYDTLFNLIGTTYGGDGQTTFALPNLSGRLPFHIGQHPGGTKNFVPGEVGGSESTTLVNSNLPPHQHGARLVQAASLPVVASPGQSTPQDQGYLAMGTYAGIGMANIYAAPSASSSSKINLAGQPATGGTVVLQNRGGAQPFSIMPPYLPINYIISLFGVYPSPS